MSHEPTNSTEKRETTDARRRSTTVPRWTVPLSVVLHGGLIAAISGALVLQREIPKEQPITVAFVDPAESVAASEPRLDRIEETSVPEDTESPDLDPLFDDQLQTGHAAHESNTFEEPPAVPHGTFVDRVFDALRRTPPALAAAVQQQSEPPRIVETAMHAAQKRPVESTTPAQAATVARPLTDNPPPHYPAASKRRGHEGVALVRVRVDASGKVLDAEVVESSGHRSLDSAALEAIRGWRFAPATESGLAIEGITDVPVRFRLVDPS